jgi:hypothetical protein
LPCSQTEEANEVSDTISRGIHLPSHGSYCSDRANKEYG